MLPQSPPRPIVHSLDTQIRPSVWLPPASEVLPLLSAVFAGSHTSWRLMGLCSQSSGINMRNRNSAGTPGCGYTRSRAQALGSCHVTVGACSVHPHIPCYTQAQTQRVLFIPGALLASLQLQGANLSCPVSDMCFSSQEPEPETCERDWGLSLSSGGFAALQPVHGIISETRRKHACPVSAFPTITTWPQHSWKLVRNGAHGPDCLQTLARLW